MNKCCEGCKSYHPGTNIECDHYGVPPTVFVMIERCPFNYVAEVKVEKKVNPLKASKKAEKGN